MTTAPLGVILINVNPQRSLTLHDGLPLMGAAFRCGFVAPVVSLFTSRVLRNLDYPRPFVIQSADTRDTNLPLRERRLYGDEGTARRLLNAGLRDSERNGGLAIPRRRSRLSRSVEVFFFRHAPTSVCGKPRRVSCATDLLAVGGIPTRQIHGRYPILSPRFYFHGRGAFRLALKFRRK